MGNAPRASCDRVFFASRPEGEICHGLAALYQV
jgi:hypothetical protein